LNLNYLCILADAASQPAPGSVPAPWWANPQALIFPIIIGLLFFMIMSSSRTKKNEQKTRDSMLGNLKRGDRVVTIGGILGSVVEVRDADVVLKVDEGSNTKIKFSRDAIKRVITDDQTPASN
jgi:preprotein translocase subunit YajC